MSFLVEIISPEGKVFSGQVKKITVPAITGTLTVLTHHMPLFTPLEAGKIKITNLQDKVRYISIGKGMMEVRREKVSLLTESPEYTEAAAKEKARQAEEKVEKIKKQKPKKELFTPKKAVRRSLVDLKKIKRRKKAPFSSESQA